MSSITIIHSVTSDLVQPVLQLLETDTLNMESLQFLPQLAVFGQLITEAGQSLKKEHRQTFNNEIQFIIMRMYVQFIQY